MAEYKIVADTSRHYQVKQKAIYGSFASVSEAWDTLRLSVIGEVSCTLFEKQDIEIPTNSNNLYMPVHNKTYPNFCIKDKKYITKYYIPVLMGLSTHEYKID